MKSLLTILLLAFAYFSSNAQSGSITNINIAQRTDGSGLVDIYFDLSGSEDAYDINIEISFNNGGSYAFISPQFLSGAINSITPGSNKHIIWNGLESFPDTYSTQSKIKIIAFDNGSGGSGIPCPGMPTVTDIDGNTYNTVLIGSQCWMAENLKTTTYQNGTAIPKVTDANAWSNLTTSAYVWYDNDISWKDSYGALYNWYTTVDANGLCPSGWHVPSDEEWGQLIDCMVAQGFPNSDVNNPNGAGNALKSCRQVNSPLGGDCNTSEHPRWEFFYETVYGFDEFGFSALPGGGRGSNGSYYWVGGHGYWWTSTEYSDETAWIRHVSPLAGIVNQYNNFNKTGGFSLRCIKD